MRNVAFLSFGLAGFLLNACSSDENSNGNSPGLGGSPEMAIGSQMPAGSEGNAAGAGGSGPPMMSSGATGGASSEGLGGNTPLEGIGGAPDVSSGGSAEPGAGGAMGEDAGGPAPPADDPSMSFFVTSRGSGSGGDFGGIAGADALCTQLATEASAELGHSERVRFMQNVPSWNSSHDTGCSEPAPGANFQAGTVSQGGGRGAIYCFAID